MCPQLELLEGVLVLGSMSEDSASFNRSWMDLLGLPSTREILSLVPRQTIKKHSKCRYFVAQPDIGERGVELRACGGAPVVMESSGDTGGGKRLNLLSSRDLVRYVSSYEKTSNRTNPNLKQSEIDIRGKAFVVPLPLTIRICVAHDSTNTNCRIYNLLFSPKKPEETRTYETTCSRRYPLSKWPKNDCCRRRISLTREGAYVISSALASEESHVRTIWVKSLEAKTYVGKEIVRAAYTIVIVILIISDSLDENKSKRRIFLLFCVS